MKRYGSINSLAILPFVNESADSDAEYLSDGITESIINNISQLPNVRVLARNTVFRYKGKDVDHQDIAAQLGVRAIVTGRVRQLGDTLIVAAELMDAANRSQLWGEQYKRKLAHIMELQDEIAQEICEKLRLRLSGSDKKRLTRRYTEKSQAYQFYLKGRYFWNKRSRDGFKTAIKYFHQATEEDPCYGLAYVGLADCYQLLPGFGVSSPKESLPKARAAVIRALEIDDQIAEAHASLARITMFQDWDWTKAEREFKRAIDLNANYPTAHHWYATYLRLMERFDEAVSQATRALELDPLSLVIHTNLAMNFFYARRFDQSIRLFQKTIDLDREFYIGHMIGLPYEQVGMHEEAIVAFQTALTLSGGDPEISSCLGHAYAVSGRRIEAQKVLQELNELAAKRYVEAYGIAVIHAGLGEIDLAFEWLERAYENRDEPAPLMKVDPRLDGLRSDPRYTSLLKRMELDSEAVGAAIAVSGAPV